MNREEVELCCRIAERVSYCKKLTEDKDLRNGLSDILEQIALHCDTSAENLLLGKVDAVLENGNPRVTTTVKWTGFHGTKLLRFRGGRLGSHPLTGELAWRVSPVVAKRLNGDVCGIKECRCGDKIAFQVAEEDDGWIDIREIQTSDRERRSN